VIAPHAEKCRNDPSRIFNIRLFVSMSLVRACYCCAVRGAHPLTTLHLSLRLRAMTGSARWPGGACAHRSVRSHPARVSDGEPSDRFRLPADPSCACRSRLKKSASELASGTRSRRCSPQVCRFAPELPQQHALIALSRQRRKGPSTFAPR
jgi:hypothetical protein